MKFTCSVQFDDGAIKRFNFMADNEVDACWQSRDIADENAAALVDVWHARRPVSRRR